ncbi:hypothetical protein GGI25_000902 [Coemansia spiralis]|uniref:Thioesterase domain-containing protein n=2 Tax=Coemansia TaxID=4863 RepID=A0A9W8GC03_9FUNG|nr:hypothetical protein EDC05_001731 [Coemansia umbellata]KAJ2623639.1 hypothetical protein GGI26_002277 [Coemansia sp. RSA 1358]KAJ2680309.1 hypothetical protein GGI25_000902 [Coemansia spiralis]
MALTSASSLLNQPSIVSAAILARRLFDMWRTRDAADIIRERASLPAVDKLTNNPECTPVDINAVLNNTAGCNSHFDYQAASKVLPLAFGWNNSSEFTQQLLTSTIPTDRMPCTRRFDNMQLHIPMVTLIDHINDNVSGHPGLIHGGMTTVIAHSSMSLVAALNSPKNAQITPLSLNMDYRKPIRTSDFVKIHTWLYQHRDNELKVAVHFYNLKDEMLVEAVSDIAVRTPSLVLQK